jgi:hypothetical protein
MRPKLHTYSSLRHTISLNVERWRWVMRGKTPTIKELTGNRGTQRSCKHYWVIESPRGPISQGVCKFCGVRRRFDNLGPEWWGRSDTPELLVPSLPDLELAEEQG